MESLDNFSEWSRHLYQLERNDPKLYLSDAAQRDLVKLNVDRKILDDKSKLSEFLPSEFLIEEFGLIQDKEFVPFSDEHPTFASLKGIPLVVKDVSTSNGDNVFFIGGLNDSMTHNDAYSILHNQSTTRTFLVTRWASMHNYAGIVWPYGSNTIRILTFISANGDARIASSVHKWATLSSGKVDNWNKGGLSTTISNGVLMDTMEDFTRFCERGNLGSNRPPSYPREAIRHRFHLDSGIDILGTTVPFWLETEQLVLKAAEILNPRLKVVGWDVIVTPDGPKIIEGNASPEVQLMQVHYPLLTAPAFLEFLQENSVKGL